MCCYFAMRCYINSLALTALTLGSAAAAATYEHRIYDHSSPQSSNNGIASQAFFFVCGSKIDGLDGKYMLLQDDSSNGRLRSDVDTPVFVREDDEEDDGDNGETEDSTLAVIEANHQQQKDMRLFRHNGFWMFADVSVWPPATHFRCDPNKRDALRMPEELDMLAVCHVNLLTPPRMGFSPARVGQGISHLVLQTRACSTKIAESQKREASTSDNLTKLAASVSSLASRFSEL